MAVGVLILFGLLIAAGSRYLFVTSIKGGNFKSVFALTKPLSNSQRAILRKYFKFYLYLPPKSQRIFENRLVKFIALKNFVPRNMPLVTVEMQVLIAASAIQLTFGYPNVFLSYFKNIVIFPDQFYSKEGQAYHKGEVNPKAKAIAISWRHFAEGYASSEGVNLGLHEMAHALQLENIVVNNEYNFLNQQAINKWQVLADLEIEKIKSGESSLLRPYGATNNSEFFAVAVEVFFERPSDFIKYNQALYQALANVLRQDPIRLYKRL